MDARRTAITILFILMNLINVVAADKYWVGNGTSTNWNSTSNWSSSSGGASGAAVPTAADRVFFNNLRNGNCVLNSSVSIQSISIVNYTGSINLNGNTLTITGAGIG